MPEQPSGALLAADIADQPAALATLAVRCRGDLRRAAALVEGAGTVHFAGIGSSGHAAALGAASMNRWGGHPGVLMPPPAEGLEPPRAGVLVLVSQSGRTPAVVALARRARRHGLAVIAVVNMAGSPLGDIGDVELACDVGAERVVAATKSVTAAALVLRLLAARRLGSTGSRLRLTLDAATGVALPPVAGQPDAVIAGGFAGQTVADEIALKFAEIAGFRAASESPVDFLHGPAAAGTPALALLWADDPNHSRLAALAAVQLLDMDSLVPRSGDDAVDALAMLIVGQRLALECARQRGQDPDASRGMTKVTDTR